MPPEDAVLQNNMEFEVTSLCYLETNDYNREIIQPKLIESVFSGRGFGKRPGWIFFASASASARAECMVEERCKTRKESEEGSSVHFFFSLECSKWKGR